MTGVFTTHSHRENSTVVCVCFLSGKAKGRAEGGKAVFTNVRVSTFFRFPPEVFSRLVPGTENVGSGNQPRLLCGGPGRM